MSDSSRAVTTADEPLSVPRRWMPVPGVVLPIAYLVLLLASALLLPRVFALDPLKQDLDNALANPSAAHPLGTDDLGRGVATRLLVASVPSIASAAMAVLIGLVLGCVLGFLPYLGGRVARIVADRVAETVLSFPPIVLALAITGALGVSLRNAMIAIGIVFAPTIARLASNEMKLITGTYYVEAARTAGASRPWILVKHVIPNCARPIVVQSSSLFAVAILAEAALSFIGVGIQPPNASWGSMLGRGFQYLRDLPMQSIAPGALIAVTVLAVNALSNALSRSK